MGKHVFADGSHEDRSGTGESSRSSPLRIKAAVAEISAAIQRRLSVGSKRHGNRPAPRRCTESD